MSPILLMVLILCGALVGFATGIVRYDIVALLALLVACMCGLVPPEKAFLGFGHPAVITVAAVLVISRGMLNSGLVDVLSSRLLKIGKNLPKQIFVLTATVIVASAFMNNVGALALLLPVALKIARDSERPASLYLMPLAFGSLLGGMTTMIGTPPNVIVANFWAEVSGKPFGLFSYTPVGVVVALTGLIFLVLASGVLLPRRKSKTARDDLFQIEAYLGELHVGEQSKLIGKTLSELGDICQEPPPVIAVVRGGRRVPAHRFNGIFQNGDVLLVEAETEEIKRLSEEAVLNIRKEKEEAELDPASLRIAEAVVRQDSILNGQSALSLRLAARYGVQVVAVAREGRRLRERVGHIKFRAGDVLLIQGESAALQEALSAIGCLPLMDRDLRLGKPRRLLLAVSLFGAGIFSVVMGWAPAAIALTGVAVVMTLVKLLNLREAYEAIDWPVIILLGAMIPVGEAMESSGTAKWLADGLLVMGKQWPPVVSLTVLLILTMCLSDVINNAAAAVLMAPIALGLARGLEAQPEAFLMAVAIGSSCAFLTPIGHQSNTLIMGPGGYRFGDYWRLGLPLEVLIVIVAIPMLLLVWPL